MSAATEGNLPPVMTQGNLVEVLGREVRQGSPELDGPTEAVLFCEHAYFYEHLVIKLNSGSEFPTLIQIQIQIPQCAA